MYISTIDGNDENMQTLCLYVEGNYTEPDQLHSFYVESISCLPATLASWIELISKAYYTITNLSQYSLCWKHSGFHTDM